jgi:hypothetical protein
MSNRDDGVCIYPDCHCPFDAPADPNWCAKGLPHLRAPNTEAQRAAEGGPTGAQSSTTYTGERHD